MSGKAPEETAATASINSINAYEMNEDILTNALETLEAEEDENTIEEERDEEEPIVEEQAKTTEGSEITSSGMTASEITNSLMGVRQDRPADISDSSKFNSNLNGQPKSSKTLDAYDPSRNRFATPQYLVSNDQILYDGNFWDGDEDTSITEQAADFVNKLYLKRNAFIDQHTIVDYTQDSYDYDDINLTGLMQKPNNFIIIGKPGVGSSTIGKMFAEKMNLIYLSPATVVNYFEPNRRLEIMLEEKFDETPVQYQSKGLDDRLIFDLICQRMQAGDVNHRGYILDGWPMVRSEEISIAEQLEMTKQLPFKPDIVFIMQMQDRDLFKRRVDQKLDPVTMQVYTKNQYIRTSVPTADTETLQGVLTMKNSKASLSSPVTPSVTTVSSSGNVSKDNKAPEKATEGIDDQDDNFMPLPLPSEIVGRLISRLEDHPVQVKRDFDKFNKAIPALQSFINSLDRTKVFELDPYWSPKTILKNAMSIMKALGIVPCVSPIEIFRPAEGYSNRLRPEDELEGYSTGEEGSCIPDPKDKQPTEEFQPDWVAVMRSVVVRGRIDPRFRWRISRWNNICPVALKEGRSTSGKPELAYGLHDKVYFLSSIEAVEKFKFNPREYLLGDMPTSPVKIIVTGQPLAGKTMFANKLASITGGTVIDMDKQMKITIDQIKQRFVFKARLEATLEVKKSLNKKNYDEWKRQERQRREQAHKWIADYIRRKASEEINRILALEREERMKKYRKMRYESEWHELATAFKTSPCTAEALSFSWKKFVEDIRKGVETWKHQDKLELAWDLFNGGKLKYKSNSKTGPVKLVRYNRGDSNEDSLGLLNDSDGDVSEEDETISEDESVDGETEAEVVRKKKKLRRKRKKRPFCSELKKEEEITVVTDDEDSSLFPSDAEPDESLRLRYPEMCLELTEPVPKPAEVGDQNEQVQAYVKSKVEEVVNWVETMPREIYEEVLNLSIRQAEDLFHKNYPYAHLSGGWIIENMANDVEKWRSILRNPELCPDQVVVLQDTSDDFSKLVNRLKMLYIGKKAGRKNSRIRKSTGEVFEGEDGYLEEATEGDESYLHYDQKGSVENKTVQIGGNIVNEKDYLRGQVCETKSGIIQIENDQQRHQSRVLSPTLSETFHENTGADGSALRSTPSNKENAIMSRKASKATYNNDSSSALPVSTSTLLDGKCIPASSILASEKEMGQISTKKLVPFEMNVLVPLKEAIRVSSNTEIDLKQVDEEEGEGVADEDIFSRDILGYSQAVAEAERKGTFGFEARSDTYSVFAGEDNDYILTPSEMNTPLRRAGDDDENPDCIPGEFNTLPSNCSPKEDPVSVKKAFVKKITAFVEFWNMVFPVINEQKVNHWELGVIDESNLEEKAEKWWKTLEGRFQNPPKPVTSGEMEEDDTDVVESRALWGKTVIRSEDAGEVSDYGEDGGEESSDTDFLEVSRLRGLHHKPNEYRTTIEDIERNRLFGEFNYYCPVTLRDSQLICKGNPRFAARYQDRLYYMLNKDAAKRFIENPTTFLQRGKEKCIPPPRICITGAPGCGQKEVAIDMCKKSGIYYVNFRERLHELIKSRIGEDVGPFLSCNIVTRPESLPGTPPENARDLNSLLPTHDYDEEASGESDSFDPNTEWIKEKKERREMEMLALKSLGTLEKAQVDCFPMFSILKTEVKAEQAYPDGQLTAMEKHIKAFLECGTQLPSFVLDEFILPLWKEEPFLSNGFILVGFPNSAKDVQYMADKMCFPEKVYIMECKRKTCRNRMIEEVVNRIRKKKNLGAIKRNRRSMYEYKNRLSKEYNAEIGLINRMNKLDLDYQSNRKIFGEVESMKAGKAIYHYHHITTKMNNAMKVELNQRRINWLSLNADYSLLEATNKLIKALTPSLRYRNNFFEPTYILYSDEAEVLLQNRYFHLSRFKRWCPVEVSKGNQGINLWNAPGVTKYPVLFRNYIYFIAGEENLSKFREQVLQMTQQMTPLPHVPFHIVIIGPPYAGKTEMAKRIAKNLGLLYIYEDDVIDQILTHSSQNALDHDPLQDAAGPQTMGFAQKVHTYLKSGHSIPRYMYYESLSYAMLDPLAQHHGCVFDGYPMEDESIQELLERGVVPAVVVRIEIQLETALQRCESKRRIPNYNFQGFVQDCDEVVTLQYERYGPMASPCIFRYGTQMRCLITVDGTQNPAKLYEIISSQCFQAQTLRQKYILAKLTSKAALQRN